MYRTKNQTCKALSESSESMSLIGDIESDSVILDTETTGLDERAEIVELAIIDQHGTFCSIA